MNIKTLFQNILNGFKPQPEIKDEVVLKFLKVLETVQQEGVSCEDMYTQLDEFVEREVGSHDAARIMPYIQEHIDVCPECCDQYTALMDVLEHTKQG